MNQTAFSSLNLQPNLLGNIASLGFVKMTPIQAGSLPHILAGKDLIGQAKTGSGKTVAFGLGLLNHLNIESFCIQSLIICPTRELANQVATVIRQLARTLPNVKTLTLCGGMSFRPQALSLEHGAHIVVGTPGRIGKHLRKGNLKLDTLSMLILDEGDRMLEMGFQDELDAIIEQAPPQRQTLLFSATYPATIQTIAKRVMIAPVLVQVDTDHDSSSIEQHFYKVGNDHQRLTAVRLLLMQHRPESTLVFCNTKAEAQNVSNQLSESGFSALALHGDLEQRERDETLVQFSNKSVSILVATDVAARGLDIDSIDAVINYHISRDFEVHIHRIGRTGRADSTGIACSLYSEKERHKVSLLQKFLNHPINSEPLPSKPLLDEPKMEPAMATLKIKAGKKQKMRPGNILGALTGENGLKGNQVGKINVCNDWSYVAITRGAIERALKKLRAEQWKGRPIQVRLIQSRSSRQRYKQNN